MGNNKVPGNNPFKTTAHIIVIRIDIAIIALNKLNYFGIMM
jgi:hypothetical protein